MKKKATPSNNPAKKHFNAAEVMLVVINTDQTVSHINRKGCNLLGYKEKDIIGKNWFDNFLPENIREEIKTVFNGLINGKVSLVEYYENPVLTKSGKEKVIAWHNTIMKDEKGKIICTISSGEDLTGRKKAEQKLEEFKFISDHSSDAHYLLNRDAKFLYVNETACKMMGYTEEEMLKLSVPDVDIVFDMSKYSDLFDLIQNEVIPPIETTNIRKDGSTFPSELTVTGYQIDGKPSMFAALRDITERKAAEDLIRQAKYDWEDIFNSITDIITIHDKDFNIVRYNKAAEKVLGMPLLKNVQVKCHKFYHGTESPPEDCPSCGCLETKKPFAFERFEPYLNIFVEIRAIPRFDKDNQLSGSIHIVRDITERKRIEAEILSISKFPSENMNPVLRINRDKTILYMNEAFNKLLISEGLSEKDTLKILPKNLYALIDSALQSERPHIMVEVDVSDRVISYNIIPIPGHGYVNLYGRDITDRKNAQVQLMNKEKFLKDIFDSIQDGISILDSEMNIIRVNKAMERWYSHAMPLVGEKCYAAYHGRREICNNCPSHKTLQSGKSSYSVVPKTGLDKKQTGWMDLYSFPLFDDKTGEIKGVIEYVRDISDRKIAEKELKKRVAELERFYDMAVGREVKMKELKEELKKLKVRLSNYTKD